jgi:hypothetical protein
VTPLWRKRWLYFVAIFCGFMFAAAGTAAVPASAQWTSGIVCGSGYHLTHQSSDTSYGNTSQTSVGFRCVNGAGASTSVGTLSIFGLQFVLGTLASFGIMFAVGSALRLRSTPARA